VQTVFVFGKRFSVFLWYRSPRLFGGLNHGLMVAVVSARFLLAMLALSAWRPTGNEAGEIARS
jgi:hypothetical protein